MVYLTRTPRSYSLPAKGNKKWQYSWWLIFLSKKNININLSSLSNSVQIQANTGRERFAQRRGLRGGCVTGVRIAIPRNGGKVPEISSSVTPVDYNIERSWRGERKQRGNYPSIICWTEGAKKMRKTKIIMAMGLPITITITITKSFCNSSSNTGRSDNDRNSPPSSRNSNNTSNSNNSSDRSSYNDSLTSSKYFLVAIFYSNLILDEVRESL